MYQPAPHTIVVVDRLGTVFNTHIHHPEPCELGDNM
jgi:hypothetical protein